MLSTFSSSFANVEQLSNMPVAACSVAAAWATVPLALRASGRADGARSRQQMLAKEQCDQICRRAWPVAGAAGRGSGACAASSRGSDCAVSEPRAEGPSLQRSAAAAAAVESASSGQLDPAQLDAAIAAALQRVAAGMTVLQSGGAVSGRQQTPSVPAAAPAAADQLSADELHRLVEEEVHTAFQAEMSSAKQTVREVTLRSAFRRRRRCCCCCCCCCRRCHCRCRC